MASPHAAHLLRRGALCSSGCARAHLNRQILKRISCCAYLAHSIARISVAAHHHRSGACREKKKKKAKDCCITTGGTLARGARRQASARMKNALNKRASGMRIAAHMLRTRPPHDVTHAATHTHRCGDAHQPPLSMRTCVPVVRCPLCHAALYGGIFLKRAVLRAASINRAARCGRHRRNRSCAGAHGAYKRGTSCVSAAR